MGESVAVSESTAVSESAETKGSLTAVGVLAAVGCSMAFNELVVVSAHSTSVQEGAAQTGPRIPASIEEAEMSLNRNFDLVMAWGPRFSHTRAMRLERCRKYFPEQRLWRRRKYDQDELGWGWAEEVLQAYPALEQLKSEQRLGCIDQQSARHYGRGPIPTTVVGKDKPAVQAPVPVQRLTLSPKQTATVRNECRIRPDGNEAEISTGPEAKRKAKTKLTERQSTLNSWLQSIAPEVTHNADYSNTSGTNIAPCSSSGNPSPAKLISGGGEQVSTSIPPVPAQHLPRSQTSASTRLYHVGLIPDSPVIPDRSPWIPGTSGLYPNFGHRSNQFPI